LLSARHQPPSLAVIEVGSTAGSRAGSLLNRAAHIGMRVQHYRFAARGAEREVRATLEYLAGSDRFHGFLVQPPVGEELEAMLAASPGLARRDLDGVHPLNLGQRPPLAGLACLKLLESQGLSVAGRRVVVLGRTAWLAQPLALLLLAHDATVTICHEMTRDLSRHSRQAEILIAATGVVGLVRASMVGPSTTVLDLGSYVRGGDFSEGDVDLDAVRLVAGAVTPCPDGLEPLIDCLRLAGAVTACEQQMPAKKKTGKVRR
ncbi:MAG: bifunctional 5,10-methylenetetrahydrofolate dehydrogenase/5,10-methenyltetrahydrofolate cyclohydrolase, partial [Candidatus Eremiobacteraeota bacterium]|nr:bifunctional 5,10-methylenetetrahydrofolate dehydrogenase/5,10-methenyltetrahydrofolate cyclohydrolase [Candidatus Eremiobacteraeota bacterium]